MMKRWTALLLAVLVVLPMLIACGGSKDPADTTTAATTQGADAEATTAATEPAETEDIAVANVPRTPTTAATPLPSSSAVISRTAVRRMTSSPRP